MTSPKHYESWRGDRRENEKSGPIRYYRAPGCASWPIPLLGEIKIMWLLAQQLAVIAKQEKPNILHPHSPILNALPALWVGKRIGIPVVYEMRSSWEDAAVDRGAYTDRSWKYKISRALETWVCFKADHVTVICDGLKSDLIRRGIGPNKITVIPNGVDLDKFRPRQGGPISRDKLGLRGKKVVAFLGSFFKWEGLDLLVEAVAELSRARKDVALLMVGGGEMEVPLKEQIRLLGIGGQVVMPGWIPQEDTLELYPFIDVLAFPRRSTYLTERVTPLKPLEAMAMGKAVIASDVGGHRELIHHEHTGILFKAGNASALAAGLARLFDSLQVRERLGNAGLQWVTQERSWTKTTEGYREAYKQCLNHAGLDNLEAKEELS